MTFCYKTICGAEVWQYLPEIIIGWLPLIGLLLMALFFLAVILNVITGGWLFSKVWPDTVRPQPADYSNPYHYTGPTPGEEYEEEEPEEEPEPEPDWPNYVECNAVMESPKSLEHQADASIVAGY